MRFDIEEGNRKVETWNEKSNKHNSSLIKSYLGMVLKVIWS